MHLGGLGNSFQTYGASDIKFGIMGVSQSNRHISINQSQALQLATWKQCFFVQVSDVVTLVIMHKEAI